MKVLLISMPDVSDLIDYFIRFPNLAIVSLAGNLPGHDVRALDLVTCRSAVGRVLGKALDWFRPDIVGLSAMTFQFDTLIKVARFVRNHSPSAKIVAGGYHVTLMGSEWVNEHKHLDYLIRGEGEHAFAALLSELERAMPDLSRIPGLSYSTQTGWSHNPKGPLADLKTIMLPDRSARLINSFYGLGDPVDVVETSRGCPFDCTFCSITAMYGHAFRTFPLERIVEDLQVIRRRGGKIIFFADDNITYDIGHFRSVCRAIVENGLNDVVYSAQVTAVGIARNPDLVKEMAQANFRIVFVGFESMDPSALRHIKKPSNPDINMEAATLLRRRGIAIVAGGIFGYPDDTKETVKKQFDLYKKLRPDLLYPQFLTPYPGTRLRRELLAQKLVTNINDFRSYDGFSCNIHTRHLSRSSLYRLLRSQGVKAFLDPRMLAGNLILRDRPFAFLLSNLRAFIDRIFNVIAGRPRSFSIKIKKLE